MDEAVNALLELIKARAKEPLKYAKAIYDPKEKTYRIKIVLLKPMPFSALREIVNVAESRGFQVYIYAPHARAIRLDLKRG
ncbi:MAG: hypothetical protein ABWJ97_03775 [Thermoproteus sp.]